MAEVMLLLSRCPCLQSTNNVKFKTKWNRWHKTE